MTLTVAISTLTSRIHAIDAAALPPTKDVDYHLFVQDDGGCAQGPPLPDRADITVTQLDGLGVTKSRNAAIAHARGDIIVFADDDLVLAADAYPALMRQFTDNPDLDFVCGRLQRENGAPFKRYPRAGTVATRLNTARLGTPELAIRTHSIRAAKVGFDTDFGAGSANWLGDEYIFVCDCLRARLTGRHLDLHLATHPHDSSGQDNSPATMPIREAALRRALGPFSWPYRAAFAIKHRNKFKNLSGFLRFIGP